MKSKKLMTVAFLSAVALAGSAAQQDQEPMTKENGTYVVNTTTLGKDVKGYMGVTPVKVYIKKNKVEKVEFLGNQESPKYFNKVKRALQGRWDGMKVKDAVKQQVDGVTGATYSSEAVKKNVQLGLNYYLKNK
jgi:electron transport complex protein RnfG